MFNTTKIDDCDPGIVYKPESTWLRNGTVITTKTAQATALIQFYGTQICAYGTIQNPKLDQGPFVSCSVDEQPVVQVQSNLKPQSLTDKNECLCTITVPLATHKFRITNLVNNTLLSLDCFIISQPARVDNQPGGVSFTSISSSQSTTKIPSPKQSYNQSSRSYSATISSTMTVYPPTISSAVAGDSTTASSRNSGQIIGGTIGGLVLLVIAGLVGIWFVKKRRRANRWKAPSAMFADYTPYPYAGNRTYRNLS